MKLLSTINPHLLRSKDCKCIEINSLWYYELKHVISDIDFPYSIIKGEVLSVLAYGERGYRRSKDIDILICKKDIKKLYRILENHGFTNRLYDEYGEIRALTREEEIMFANSHQVAPYYKDIDNCDQVLKIDINFDVFWGEYRGKKIDISTFLSDTIDLKLYDYPVKSLSIMKAFIEVCLHHYKEMNSIYKFRSKNPISTIMFQDIYCFYKRHIESQINDLYAYSFEHEIQNYIYYILYFTSKVFPDTILENNIKIFETREGIKNLEYYGLADKEKRKWSINFYNRLDSQNIYSYIENNCSQENIKKIKTIYSIYENMDLQ